jgi:drug/metabolite transporter (DMT)-like permease
MPSPTLLRVAPFVFVLIWSSGWIVAKYAAPYADPLTFLSVRYVCAALVVGAFALAVGAPMPRGRREAGHLLLSGVLIHGVYLGGVWWAISRGVPAGVSALIAALQPLLAAVLAAPLTGERISPVRWLGVALGFGGILLVLQPKLAGVEPGALGPLVAALGVNVLAMVGVTLGTFHQKRRLPDVNLRTLATWQYLGALAFTLPLALLTEPLRFEVRLETALALAWSVLVLSVVAIGLMLMMIRHGSVARLSALIYLVPPTAAVQAYLMFGEALEPVQLAGMAVVVAGVYLATRR